MAMLCWSNKYLHFCVSFDKEKLQLVYLIKFPVYLWYVKSLCCIEPMKLHLSTLQQTMIGKKNWANEIEGIMTIVQFTVWDCDKWIQSELDRLTVGNPIRSNPKGITTFMTGIVTYNWTRFLLHQIYSRFHKNCNNLKWRLVIHMFRDCKLS